MTQLNTLNCRCNETSVSRLWCNWYFQWYRDCSMLNKKRWTSFLWKKKIYSLCEKFCKMSKVHLAEIRSPVVQTRVVVYDCLWSNSFKLCQTWPGLSMGNPIVQRTVKQSLKVLRLLECSKIWDLTRFYKPRARMMTKLQTKEDFLVFFKVCETLV